MRTLRLFLTLAILLIGSVSSFAAPGPPTTGTTTGGPSCWPPPCVPIDGGVAFLIVAGAAYGAKKILNSRKKQESIS